EEAAKEKPAKEEPAKEEPKEASKEAPEADSKSAKEADRAEADRGASRAVDVRVPDIGEAENVEVIEVAVKVGDQIAEDDLLVVVESDKASMEIPSPHSGKVLEVHVSTGSEVEEGTRLVTLEVGEAAAEEDRDREIAPAGKEAAAKEKAPRKEEASGKAEARPKAEEGPKGEQGPKKEAGAEEGRDREIAPTAGVGVYAGPAVRRLARELGVDLTAVRGSGNRGRIVKDDVKGFVKERLAGAPAGAPATGGLPAMPAVDFSKFGEIEEQPLSRIRARGAENLQRSWLNLPHVTQHDDVDITDLEEFRASLRSEGEARGVKVTPLAFIIKACCQVLKEFPTVNASLDPAAKNFIIKRYYHIGMAVDTPDGLVVPVIRDADRKGIWELSAEVVELAEKARNKKLNPSEMQGGSFSVTSLGAIGGTGFTPIINAPEVAILGVSRTTMRPQWNGKEFVPRKMLPLSLSYDHRAINGAEAGRFVARLGELLADIRRLAL
ncbi:MAG: dihydrolipoyllysine-residue acetyltransferase, partial [Pseudomonadales bacterium]